MSIFIFWPCYLAAPNRDIGVEQYWGCFVAVDTLIIQG